MLSDKQVRHIEDQQTRQAKVRNTAHKVARKAGLISIADSISNGDKLTKMEIQAVFAAAKDIKPIPEGKAKLVYWSLINPLEYRHFNPFGQELKQN